MRKMTVIAMIWLAAACLAVAQGTRVVELVSMNPSGVLAPWSTPFNAYAAPNGNIMQMAPVAMGPDGNLYYIQIDAYGNVLSSMGNYATAPSTCSTGNTYFNTTSKTPYYCSAVNTWTAFGSGGGSSVVITSGTIDGTTIGQTTPAAGSFSTLTSGTVSSAAKAAIPTGAHGFACDESSTAGVPASSVDYIRCNSSTHSLLASMNGGAEVALLYNGGAAGTPSAIGLAHGTGLPLSGLAAQAQDTVVMNEGASGAPSAVAMPTSGTNGCAGATNALTYNTTTHALGCNTISGGGGGTAIWYSPFGTANNGSVPVAGNGNANQIYGFGFSPSSNVSFSAIYAVSSTADGTGYYSLAVTDSNGNLICHPTTGTHVPTSGSLWTNTCSEGTVTLSAGSVYILLNTGTASTGTINGLGYAQIGPYSNASVSGCSSSTGVISGTCSISLAPTVYGATRIPEVTLH